MDEALYIKSYNLDTSKENDDTIVYGLEVDDTITVLTFKSKTLMNVLSDIAGLLIISRVLTLFLNSFNEWMFNRKIKMENNEEFRDIFTY